MIKKYKNYIIFGVIIAVLLGAYLLLTIDTKTPEDTSYEIPESIEIISVDSEKIAEISIKNESGEYTFVYGDKITVKGKESIDIDVDRIKKFCQEVSTVVADSIISENVNDFAQFGLDNPKAFLKITDKSGNANTIYLGNESPVGNGYYAVKNDEKTVYLIASYNCNGILRKLDHYRNTVLLTVDAGDVNYVSYEKKDGTKVSFKRYEQVNSDEPNNIFAAFKMTSPYEWDADGGEVSKILEPFVEFSIMEYASDDPSDNSKFGFNPWSSKIVIDQTEGADYNILLGNSVDGILYLKLADKNGIYGVNAAAFSFLDLEPKAYLQNFAYLKSIDTVKKMVYNYKDSVKGEFEIKKVSEEEHDVRKDGKNISQSDFKKLYIELVSLSIAGDLKYSPSGTPLLTYEFYFNDGSKDTVSYYKYDDRKIALAINGRVQFYVDSAEFDARTKTINEIINKF